MAVLIAALILFAAGWLASHAGVKAVLFFVTGFLFSQFWTTRNRRHR